MGRRKIEIEKIESKPTRWVTFCKRRQGLKNKAGELARLCDVEIGLIMFNDRGKLDEYAANNNMQDIITRYMNYHEESISDICSDDVSLSEANHHQSLQQDDDKLHQQLEHLQKDTRHMMGEEINSMDVEQLEQLETTLVESLSRIRSKKDEMLIAELDNMQKKIAENEAQKVASRLGTGAAQAKVDDTKSEIQLDLMIGRSEYQGSTHVNARSYFPVTQESGNKAHTVTGQTTLQLFMQGIISRYKSYGGESSSSSLSLSEANTQLYKQEIPKLHQQIGHLQKAKGHLMGEEIGSMSTEELKQLETKLEKSLKKIRSKKNETFFAELDYLQKRDVKLEEENNCLRTAVYFPTVLLTLSV
ncbi:hypothetical protein GIB67_032199 [Kingdonia uniflora]|uniref:Uncharacterized protein n=1 Tax=Kingdonia uniflora TaxID=39325 RepID=A0A7J7MXK0_9MAGN|nr:hypothetical protein GIB67_032199 [Kingdonia uniflora]